MSRLVVVTGGSAGLGAALLAAAPAGAHRVDVSRSGRAPAGGEHWPLDLADPEDWTTFAEAFARTVADRSWERITVVHNAGTIEPIGFVGEVDTATYTRHVLLNSAATQVVGHAVLAALRDLPIRRELLLISSGAARTARPGWAAYGAAKAAGDHWVRAVGQEQAQRGGCVVLAVAPGVVATGMQERIRATDAEDFPGVERFRRLHEDGALLAPSDVAPRLWALLDDPSVSSGDVLDLRDFA
ncbi:SDR family NAD(P)-dependent oxidoreductase [Egicoccus halophilus]|uniref:Short-chain dehydrogenase/reductase n=1 Tax=Egicoccus halophilus TaxID=1670830 RepID=A0A8J3AC75_9ACTN|nr:SDR family NAD(P)-dependent oxidoreductase [Egicoccus halophilus]GGI08328.1 short-chain dehydrogenase/reductase [Egicoccus halophilus]